MLAYFHIFVRIADPDPDAVRDGFGLCRDGHAVERRALEGKADADLVAPAAAITGREVAIDAAVDLIVLGTDVDRLDDLERAVLLDLDVADEALDALFRMSRSSSPEKQQAAEDPRDQRHG